MDELDDKRLFQRTFFKQEDELKNKYYPIIQAFYSKTALFLQSESKKKTNSVLYAPDIFHQAGCSSYNFSYEDFRFPVTFAGYLPAHAAEASGIAFAAAYHIHLRAGGA